MISTTFSAHMTFEDFQCSFIKEGKKVSLELTKRESVEKVYQMGLLYLGRNEKDQATFILTIDGQTPTLQARGAIYFYAIKKLIVEPYKKGALQVTETLEDGRSDKVWFVIKDLRWQVIQREEDVPC